MSELTDEQLRAWKNTLDETTFVTLSDECGGDIERYLKADDLRAMAVELLALRARVAGLEAALREALALTWVYPARTDIAQVLDSALAQPAESGRRERDEGLPTANDARGILAAAIRVDDKL